MKDAEAQAGASVAPSAARIWWAIFATVLVAVVVYAAIAFLMFRAGDLVFTPSHHEPDLSAVEQRDAWGLGLFLGGLYGFPGVIMASVLLAPRRPSSAPLTGAGVGAFHYLLGFALLKMAWWIDGRILNPFDAGAVFLLGGWTWAYIVRLWSRRNRQKGGGQGRPMIPDHERGLDGFGIESSRRMPAGATLTESGSDPPPSLQVPNTVAITVAMILTVLVAGIVFLTIAMCVSQAYWPDRGSATGSAWSRQVRLSQALVLGGVLGLPGAMVAGGILAPLRWTRTLLVGACVALIHYALGFLLLRPALELGSEIPSYVIGMLFFTGGWLWAYAVRQWLHRHPHRLGTTLDR